MSEICKHGKIVGGIPPISCAECVREAKDEQIERLQAELREARATISRVCDAFMIGENVRDEQTIMANLNNAIRRANCLSAIEDKFFTRTLVDDEEGEYDECCLSWGETPEEYVRQFGSALGEHEARLLEEMVHKIKSTTIAESELRADIVTNCCDVLRKEAAARRTK